MKSVCGGLNTVYQSNPICSHLDVVSPDTQTFDAKLRMVDEIERSDTRRYSTNSIDKRSNSSCQHAVRTGRSASESIAYPQGQNF